LIGAETKFANATWMSVDVRFGSKADMGAQIAMSALPPIAEKFRDGRIVR
jgi:hypothetical protein